MPPVRIRQRGKAPKGTLKRLIKMLFKKHPVALIVSAVLIPFLGDLIPLPTSDMTENIRLFFLELCYGIFLGLIMQLMYFAVNLCGNFVGQASGFASAQMFDPTSQNQSIVTETFLSLVAITVIFTLNLHHLMLSAVVDSYTVWPVAQLGIKSLS